MIYNVSFSFFTVMKLSNTPANTKSKLFTFVAIVPPCSHCKCMCRASCPDCINRRSFWDKGCRDAVQNIFTLICPLFSSPMPTYAHIPLLCSLSVCTDLQEIKATSQTNEHSCHPHTHYLQRFPIPCSHKATTSIWLGSTVLQHAAVIIKSIFEYWGFLVAWLLTHTVQRLENRTMSVKFNVVSVDFHVVMIKLWVIVFLATDGCLINDSCFRRQKKPLQQLWAVKQYVQTVIG